MSAAQSFAPLIGDVASRLLGKPDHASNRDGTLRWGTHGSLKIDAEKGTWFDHEAKEGGGTLDLIVKIRGGDRPGAVDWLKEQGLVEEDSNAFYDYQDETGRTLYRVERRGTGPNRKFLHHGPDGNGGFACRKGCMREVERVPYRLPDVATAGPEEIVFICEGEKDADRLASLGLVATTNSGGASNFGQSLARHFEGKRVVLLQDNDLAGREHVQDVVRKLGRLPVALGVLALPNLPPKGDVSDWLNAGGTTDLLLSLAEQCLGKDASDADSSSECEESPPLPGESGPEHWLDCTAPPREFVVDGWIARGAAGLLGGQDGVGKSLLAQQLGTCAGVGHDFLGLAVKRCRTIYITAEDPSDELQRRQEAINDCLGISMKELCGWFKTYSLKGEIGNELGTFDGQGRLTPTERYRQIRRAALEFAAQLVFVDNAAHVFPGNENARHDVAAFLGLLERLSIEIDGAVILLAHPNKEHGKGNKQGNEYSGSTGWSAHVRNRLFLDWRNEEGDPDQRVLRRSKANYAAKGEEIVFRWHRWAFVRDEDLPADYAKELTESIRIQGENEIFLRCLRIRNSQPGREVGPSTGSNYAPARIAEMIEAKGMTKVALARAMERLLHRGLIETKEVKRKGSDMKTIVVEVSPDASERSSERPPNPSSERVRTAVRTGPKPPLIDKSISGAATETAAPEHGAQHG